MNYIVFWSSVGGEEKFNLVEFFKDSMMSHDVHVVDGLTYAGFTFKHKVDETDFVLRYSDILKPLNDKNYELFNKACLTTEQFNRLNGERQRIWYEHYTQQD